jgi:hypothetical protein
MDNIEIHVKQYGITKSKDPAKDGMHIGLETRLIIHPPKGALKILNFNYNYQARRYIKETYGGIENVGKTYHIISNFEKYGERGYRWS